MGQGILFLNIFIGQGWGAKSFSEVPGGGAICYRGEGKMKAFVCNGCIIFKVGVVFWLLQFESKSKKTRFGG